MDETLAAAAPAPEQPAPEREKETLEEVMSRHRLASVSLSSWIWRIIIGLFVGLCPRDMSRSC
jgi:hypothetical protein